MPTYLQEAFNRVCNEAKQANGYFVSLMEETCEYGGPEEGGWWRHDSHIIAYQYFSTEEVAEAAKEKVEELAKELEIQQQVIYGERCNRELDWCEARGLDADYLPEPDGPSKFYVLVSEGLPEEYRAPRHYE